MNIKDIYVKNRKKINIILISVLVLLIVILGIVLYKYNQWFREKVNSIFNFRESNGTTVSVIDISQDKINSIIGYDKYIGVLSQGKFNIYSNNANSELNIDINITNCISDSSDKYLVLAERDSNKIYLLHGKQMLYSIETDGNISNVSVNKNGYVAVNVSKSGYRSVIELYNPQGEKQFTTFFATTYVSDIKISNNNKELALVEIDTSGIKLISRIRLVQIDKLSKEDNILQLVQKEDELISKINFTNNNELIYFTQKSISKVDINGKDEQIYNIEKKDIINSDVSPSNHIIIVEKLSSGIFNTQTLIKILDKSGKEEGEYKLNGTVKTLNMSNNIICVGIGQEVHFITPTGRLIKKYKTTMDIKDVIIYNSGNSAALIFRNKIEIINI